MGKKRSGHYCIRCDRYRANEKFSGKGHRQHICKGCKSKKTTEDHLLLAKKKPNRYIKQLKVRLLAMTEFAGYIFLDINGQTYVIYVFEDATPETLRYIQILQRAKSTLQIN